MSALYVDIHQIAIRPGIPKAEVKAAIKVLERSGFSTPDPQFGNRRYWLAICEWLDRRNGVGTQSAGFNVDPGPQG